MMRFVCLGVYFHCQHVLMLTFWCTDVLNTLDCMLKIVYSFLPNDDDITAVQQKYIFVNQKKRRKSARPIKVAHRFQFQNRLLLFYVSFCVKSKICNKLHNLMYKIYAINGQKELHAPLNSICFCFLRLFQGFFFF